MKKALDVTTKGWSKDGIEQLRQKLIADEIKYKITVKLPDGKIKWVYVKNPDEVKPFCEQMGASIVKVEKF